MRIAATAYLPYRTCRVNKYPPQVPRHFVIREVRRCWCELERALASFTGSTRHVVFYNCVWSLDRTAYWLYCKVQCLLFFAFVLKWVRWGWLWVFSPYFGGAKYFYPSYWWHSSIRRGRLNNAWQGNVGRLVVGAVLYRVALLRTTHYYAKKKPRSLVFVASYLS